MRRTIFTILPALAPAREVLAVFRVDAESLGGREEEKEGISK
jgi:hypothetical protein